MFIVYSAAAEVWLFCGRLGPGARLRMGLWGWNMLVLRLYRRQRAPLRCDGVKVEPCVSGVA